MCNKINQFDTIFALLALLDRNREKDGVMEKFTHVHSVFIQNRWFRAHIVRKECDHLNKIG